MLRYLILLLPLALVSCAETPPATEKTVVPKINGHTKGVVAEADHSTYDSLSALYFSHAFIYEYVRSGEKGEFWIYHNPDTRQMLYVPEDPMIDFVVCDSLGYYYYFGDDGHGVKTVTREFVPQVTERLPFAGTAYPVSDRYLQINKTGKITTDNQIHWNGKPVRIATYEIVFQQVSGTQQIKLTEEIPVNFYQVYGFNKLSGDIQLPEVSLDFTGVFGKRQTIVRVKEPDGYELNLTAHESNPYFLEVSGYQYFESEGNGEWAKARLPLLPAE